MKNPSYHHYQVIECWDCNRAIAFFPERRKDTDKPKYWPPLSCPQCFAEKMTEEERFKLEHMGFLPTDADQKTEVEVPKS